MENTLRSRGKPQNYKFDRGGLSAEMGPYIGIVVNNSDSTRSGRLQVYIDEFGAVDGNGGPRLDDPTLWRTVRYCPPFYGATPQISGTSAGVGTYPGNRNSYGMWFTPPDIGVKVICFFVAGDPGQGYYLGCVPEPGINHMIPAIGSVSNFKYNTANQGTPFGDTRLQPVTEINDENIQISDNPRFFDQSKPVQTVVAWTLLQQGLNRDPIRGPIRSSSQRESPSSVYGISTPGKPIYQSGIDPKVLKAKLDSGAAVTTQDVTVIGRQGGHTFVMDDGDVGGTDALVRIRTAKGHQITMSDDGNCFYITHANGQTWVELGEQGTIDLFSTNSVNVRTQGVLNLHADKGINMYSGGYIRIKSKTSTQIEANTSMSLVGLNKFTAYSKTSLNLKSDGRLAMASKSGSWNGGSSLSLNAGVIHLNGGSSIPVTTPALQTGYKLTDTFYSAGQGWIPRARTLETIVTRAPSHEPYPYHNQGVDVSLNLGADNTTATTTSINPELTKKAQSLYTRVSNTAMSYGITAANYLKTPPSSTAIPPATDGDALGSALSQAEAIARGTAPVDLATAAASIFGNLIP